MGDDRVGATQVTDAADAPTGPIEVHESLLPEEHPLHRPRHSRRHVGSGVAALAFLLVPALAVVLGVRPASFENRPLATFPSVSQGWGFLGAVPLWASDHLPLRQQAVEAATSVSQDVFSEPLPAPQGAGSEVAGPVAPAVPDQQVQGPAGTTAAVTDEDTRRMAAAGYPSAITGQDGWLYYGYDVYAACRPQRTVDDVVSRLRALRSVVESSGRTFTLVVVPDKSTAVPTNLPADVLGADCASARRVEFWPRVVGEAGAVDLRDALDKRAVQAGRPLYFPQDTHWTFDGGLVLAEQLANHAEPGVTADWRRLPGVEVTGASDLPPLLGSSGTNAAEVPGLSIGGGDDRAAAVVSVDGDPVRHLGGARSGAVSGSTFVMGDSFLSWASPYLAAGFADVTVVDAVAGGRDPADVLGAAVDARAVVLEVVERSVDSGDSAYLSDEFLSAARSAFSRSPVG